MSYKPGDKVKIIDPRFYWHGRFGEVKEIKDKGIMVELFESKELFVFSTSTRDYLLFHLPEEIQDASYIDSPLFKALVKDVE